MTFLLHCKAHSVRVACLALLGLFLLVPASHADIHVDITSDNAYGFGWGDDQQIINYFGNVEAVTAAQIFSCNGGPESYTLQESAVAGNYLYIVAYADKSTTQGVLARFQADFELPVFSGIGPWEVCATGVDYDPRSGGPSLSMIDQQIVTCNEGTGDPATTSQGWVDAVGTAAGRLAIGENNTTQRAYPTPGNEFPITCQSRMGAEARWMWFNWDPANIEWPTSGSPFIWPGGGGNRTKDFLIFRLPADAVASASCEPKTQGFWKRQCATGHPHPADEASNLGDYASCLSSTATFGDLGAEGELACGEIQPFPPNDKCEQAEAQFMALLFNNCSRRLSGGCCVDNGELTVRGTINAIDALLSSPTRSFSDCVEAQELAAQVNEGAALCD